MVVACGKAGLDAVQAVLSDYPENCPPTILLVDAPADEVASAISRLDGEIPCSVEAAADGMEVAAGKVIVVHDPAHHGVVEPGSPPRFRLVGREPVGGCRPSADLLIGSLARAKIPALGGLLPGSGSDGAKGLQILAQTGGKTLVHHPADYETRDRYAAALALGLDAADLKRGDIAGWILENTARK